MNKASRKRKKLHKCFDFYFLSDYADRCNLGCDVPMFFFLLAVVKVSEIHLNAGQEHRINATDSDVVVLTEPSSLSQFVLTNSTGQRTETGFDFSFVLSDEQYTLKPTESLDLTLISVDRGRCRYFASVKADHTIKVSGIAQSLCIVGDKGSTLTVNGKKTADKVPFIQVPDGSITVKSRVTHNIFDSFLCGVYNIPVYSNSSRDFRVSAISLERAECQRTSVYALTIAGWTFLAIVIVTIAVIVLHCTRVINISAIFCFYSKMKEDIVEL